MNNYRNSDEESEALAAKYGPGQAVALQTDVTDVEQVANMLDQARSHFAAPVTTVVNNALADFSFNGDARSSAAGISLASRNSKSSFKAASAAH